MRSSRSPETKSRPPVSRLAFAMAAAALVAAAAGCGGEPAPTVRPVVARPVKTLTIGAGEARQRTFTGRTLASNRVDMSFRVGGPLVELPVKEGQEVRQGALLARIDPRDFKIRLSAARADFEKADADYRRIAALYEKDAASKAQLDQAQAAVDLAQARLDDAVAALSDSTMRAPFAARIGERFVDNFTDVQPKQPIVSLVNTDRIDVLVDLPETVVARSREGGARTFVARFAAAPGRDFELTFKEIAAQADAATRTYRTTFTMAQPDGVLILSGMTATVTWRSSQGAEGDGAEPIQVPAVALVPGPDGGQAVWVVDAAASTVHLRPVVTEGPAGAANVAITAGLKPGEVIAVSAVSSLREGLPVRPMER